MDAIKSFLKKIGVSDDQIKKLEADGADVAGIATEYQDDQETIMTTRIKTRIIEEVKPEINAQALKSVQESLKTKLKRELGLDIPNVKALEFDDFLAKATEEVKAKYKEQGDEAVKAKIKDLTDKYTEALNNAEDLKTKLTAKEQEVEQKISEFKAQAAAEKNLGNAFGKITWAGTEKQQKFFQAALRNELLSSILVAEDGTIKNKDGTPVVKDGNTIVKTLDDLVRAKAEESDMVKKNGARDDDPPGPGNHKFTVATGPDGKPINPNAEAAQAAAAKALAALGD